MNQKQLEVYAHPEGDFKVQASLHESIGKCTNYAISLGLPFRSISLSTMSQIGPSAEAFGCCYYQNEAAHEVIKLLHHRCWMRNMCTLLMFGFLLGMLTSLTNAHAVRGIPTQNYNSEHVSARSFRELKENSVKAMKANYGAVTNNQLSLKANVLHMNTTNSQIQKTEVNTRILYSDKTDASLGVSSQEFVQDNITRIKEVIRKFFIASVCILLFKVIPFAIHNCRRYGCLRHACLILCQQKKCRQEN